ncbi:TetR/AcrR family transcriptional regulator C-terminal ligand-binding domain-containing protein [Dietzia sp. CH92]|uniref:TetR/AcrR family transcriptional regulator n=1 Tax=Dietzia sp. CH92 TaxID=3051823 RepID=UPI0028D72994|nr:TetR/AcrR family transcriptional regulator C-terminal ligand-binding domain-containing protein [Dietzia sp. CH92]
MENTTGRVRVRAGGRSEKVRVAVGEATLAFLAEGQPDFTVVEVAARAGVGRRTVYRWWPTRDDLLVEALEVHVRRVPTVEVDGSWEDGLRGLAHRLAEFAADPVEVAIAAIMAGGQYPEFNRLVLRQWEPAMESWCGLVRAAADRGEAAEGVEPRTVVEALLAPIFYAPVSVRRQMTAAEVDALVDLLLCGVRKR